MSKKKIKIFGSAYGYDLAASSYDEKEKYLDSFEQGHLFARLGDVRNKKVLDAGAGTGRLTSVLIKSGADLTALDLSQKMLERLKSKTPTAKIVAGDAENMPFADNVFDIVVAAFLIVHLKNPAIFFKEAYRVLKDGGILAVSNINQKEPPEIATKEGIIKIESYYHRPEEVREELESLAFNIEAEEIIKENGVWINQIIIAQK